jgi:hypothetical protein
MGLLVVNHFLPRHDSRPNAFHETAVAFAYSYRARCAVGYVGDTNVAVAMKNAVIRLPFIAAA